MLNYPQLTFMIISENEVMARRHERYTGLLRGREIWWSQKMSENAPSWKMGCLILFESTEERNHVPVERTELQYNCPVASALHMVL